MFFLFLICDFPMLSVPQSQRSPSLRLALERLRGKEAAGTFSGISAKRDELLRGSGSSGFLVRCFVCLGIDQEDAPREALLVVLAALEVLLSLGCCM